MQTPQTPSRLSLGIKRVLVLKVNGHNSFRQFQFHQLIMTQHHKRSLHAEPTCPKEVFLRLGGDTFIVSGVLLFNGVLHYHTNPSSPMLSPLTRCSRLCPMGHTGKPRQTRYWLNERSTHYWEGLQSQGKWSWLCCCKFLAISPILSLDLLLATGFSCHESEYHILKKKKKKGINILYHIGKVRISSLSHFQEKQQIN